MPGMVFTNLVKKGQKFMKKKNLAFTLAEVLIVIGIIGVVAALTLPNLNHATGDKEKVTRLKKVYSNLTEAFDRAQAIYGPFDTWFSDLTSVENFETNSEIFAKRVTEFMKISKDCGTNEGCYPTEIKGFDGNDNSSHKGLYNYTLPDGTALSIGPDMLYVDIDGPNKGQNQNGHDVFSFIIINNNLMPIEYKGYLVDNCIEGDVGRDVSYYTYWVITNENLDYLKADEDGVCPNGAQLNWNTQTSCN